ncbi:MAG TPA: hypothetical protein VK249_06715 [Anaerolineales bacterium]|nr:hypothetical protein [Anaerolineales bacterium]
MNIIQPSRLTFWRFIFALSAALPLFSIYQLFGNLRILGVELSASRSWAALIAGLALLSLFLLLLLASTWSRYCERILSLAEFPERIPNNLRWISLLFLSLALVGFTVVFMIPFIRSHLGGLGWIRFLVFWSFSLIGMWSIKLFRRQTPWYVALLAIILSQSTLHLLLVYWPRVTDYPFAMGWSETSRFYYPSLFVSEKVYGQEYPWPILHPTLHLLLAPPYWFHAPLWFHRFWQVALRYVLVAAVAPALLKRLSIRELAARWVIGLAMFLFLFMGPVYFHLTIPVIIVLLGFSSENDRRTWVAVLGASIWCGWSRVNWYPMPGLIASVLYLMEVPYKGKNFFSYLLKPALWSVAGTLTAFVFQRIYIALSGIPDSSVFYSSLASDLLWYRLWPNSSFSFGILPGVVWVSLPVWVAIYILLRSDGGAWHPLRLILIFGALFIVCVGGILVSLKIGGGANLHNMDAYFILLLIITTYLIFARYRKENGELAHSTPLHWLLVLALIYSPVATYLQFGVGFKAYNVTRTEKVLASLQKHVDDVNARGGEILFITQRQLISMGMLNHVTLVPEYEREDLMEMAMADNLQYLGKFRKDMEDQRFAMIVVDPLNFIKLARNRSFAEENNRWVIEVAKYILCNYREETVFPVDEIALYVPQEGERKCP